MAGFGLRGVPPATWIGRSFRTDEARGLFAGCAAHTFLPLSRPQTSAMGLMLLASGHVAGWPAVRGGSERLAEAMAARIAELGGEIQTGRPVRSLTDVPDSRAVLFDLTPRQLLRMCGDALSTGYQRRLRAFRYGPGVFKVDYALSEPVPWTNPDARKAGSLHLGRHAARDRGERRPRSPAGGTPIDRSCWSASRASSTPPERPPASTRCGPTATCRRAPPWT